MAGSDRDQHGVVPNAVERELGKLLGVTAILMTICAVSLRRSVVRMHVCHTCMCIVTARMHARACRYMAKPHLRKDLLNTSLHADMHAYTSTAADHFMDDHRPVRHTPCTSRF